MTLDRPGLILANILTYNSYMTNMLHLSLWVLRRRLRQAWGLTAVTALGVLAAVILLSATALYSQTLAESGVRHGLFSQSATAMHVQVLAQNRPLGSEDYLELRNLAEAAIDQRIGNLTVGQERFGRTQAGMTLTTNPSQQPPPLGAPSGRVFFMTGFIEHSRIVSGRWPEAVGTSGPEGVELEAVVGRRVANDFGYELGDRVYVTPFRSEPSERIVLNVVGVVEPKDSRDEYWLGYPSQFSPQVVGEIQVIPAYVSEEDFLNVVGKRFPIAVGDFGFNVFIDRSQITADEVDATQTALDGLESDLNKVYPRTFVLSRLGLTLDEFERDLILAKVPVYVFVSLVIIIVLYFLALISGILGRSQAVELSLLRGRGASVAQVCGVLLLAEEILALFAVAVGPPLAWVINRYLLLPAFGDLGGGPIEISLSADAYWMGALGATLAVAVLTASAASQARSSVADAMASRSRPPSASFFHRYYLDMLVVLAVAFIWWQFAQREGFLTRTLGSRGLDFDPSIILGPVLGLLAAALLLMRVLPLLARLLVWLLIRAGPGWSSVSLARLARDPVLPSALAVMLMLATALGVYGATFQSSMSQSQSDQAEYKLGGELVLEGPSINASLARALLDDPGVESATLVLRDSISLVSGHSAFPATLIAADPAALAQSAWFREDFSDRTLNELSASIAASVGGDATGSSSGNSFGISLPAGTERVGLWLETGDLVARELQADINVWARLVNSQGRYRNLSLGEFGGPGQTQTGEEAIDGWMFLESELPALLAQSAEDWALASIFLTTSSFSHITAGRIYLDDFTIFGTEWPDDGLVLEGFDSTGQWEPLGIGGGSPDTLEASPSAARSGEGGLIFSWSATFGGEQRGIHLSPVPLPLLAIGGNGLFPGDLLSIEQSRVTIPVQVVALSDLFPTITNFDRPFLILNINSYLTYLRLLPPGSLETNPQEIWLSLIPGVDRAEIMERISEQLPSFVSITDRREVAARAAANPLAGGGWDGLTGLSMAGIGFAVVTVLLLYSAASVRDGRMDTAVSRALGLSNRQVFLSLAAERWLMAGVAIAAGAAIGYWPGIELTQLLDLSHNGRAAIPPMIPQAQVILLVSVLAGLTLAVMASVVLGSMLANRLSPVEVLREGA